MNTKLWMIPLNEVVTIALEPFSVVKMKLYEYYERTISV